MELERKQRVYICRHGETEWSLSGQHTSVTDLPLTSKGVQQVKGLASRLERIEFAQVFCSPLLRAKQTCEIAGLLDLAVIDDDLFEWRYGDYEGLKTVDIRKSVPEWSVFTHGCPGGESTQEITERADRMVEKIRLVQGDVAIFSSGHFSRVLTARWLGLPVITGRHFILNTGTLSVLTYERENPAVKMWNA
ncbi:MAG: histidine phosphatase family protein [Chlamydiota bacterium]